MTEYAGSQKEELTTKSQAAPLDRLAALRLWPSAEAETWVRNFVRSACSASSVSAVVILGSIVRPVEHAADVDLLYVYDRDKLPGEEQPLDVDIRAYKQSEIQELLSDYS